MADRSAAKTFRSRLVQTPSGSPARFPVLYAFILLVTIGNLALGFGLAVHFGFGPDMSRLAGLGRTLLTRRSRSHSPGTSGPL